jgi:hypothetical protein
MAMGNNYYPDIPFDRKRYNELVLRAPALWVSSLKCPIMLLYGADDPVEQEYKRQAVDMSNKPGAKAKQIAIENIPAADHFKAIGPAIPKMVNFFSQN